MFKEANAVEMKTSAGHQSDIIVRLCQAVERIGVHPGIMGVLIAEKAEPLYDAMVSALIENAPPTITEHIVKTDWSKSHVSGENLLAGESQTADNILRHLIGVASAYRHFDGHMDLDLLTKFEDTGFTDRKDETIFSIVRFWKGWSLDMVVMMMKEIGLKVPSALDAIHFAVHWSARAQHNWELIPSGSGYVMSNTIVIPKVVSMGGSLDVLPTMTVCNRTVQLAYVPNSRKFGPAIGSKQVNGFATSFPLLFVGKHQLGKGSSLP